METRDEKQTQATLVIEPLAGREAHDRFRLLAEHTSLMVWCTDSAGAIQYVNPAWQDFFGVSETEARMHGWQRFVHPDDREKYVATFLQALREGSPFKAHARVRRRDGSWRWIESLGAHT